MNKLTKILVLLIVLLLLVINYRTPYYSYKGGSWSVGYGSSSKNFNDLNVLENAKIYSYQKLEKENPDTRFLADPFFIKEKDMFYLFFEHQKKTDNAEIALLTSLDGINYTYKGTVLDEPFHLSYPNVFKHKNEFYMLPETKSANNVLLYKALNFPYNWQIVDTLVKNVRLKDPSIYLSDSLNFLVASDDNLNLFMYQSNSLFGNWKLHKDPIVTLGTEARPGGRIIKNDEGKIIVPLQNSTHGYGYGVSLYELDFDKNNKHSFKRVEPFFLKRNDTIEEFNFGMHHIDMQKVENNWYYVFDGNKKLNDKKKLNIRGPLKWNFLDFKNWLLN